MLLHCFWIKKKKEKPKQKQNKLEIIMKTLQHSQTINLLISGQYPNVY